MKKTFIVTFLLASLVFGIIFFFMAGIFFKDGETTSDGTLVKPIIPNEILVLLLG